MFSERLNHLMEELDAPNSVIASYAGFDRSNVSRFRSGSRVPKPTGAAVNRLADTLLIYAREKGEEKKLLSIIEMKREPEGDEEIRRAIVDWLYDPAHTGEEPAQYKNRSNDVRDFAVRLNQAIQLSRLSNVEISRLCNVDPSLISRYRSGTRAPRRDSEIRTILGVTLWQYIVKSETTARLAEIMRMDESQINEAYFCAWLFNHDISEEEEAQTAGMLIDMFGSISHELPKSMPNRDKAMEGYIRDERSIYRGLDGLREAVLRFLATVADRGAKEIWLYSDQNMDWLIKKKIFRKRWAALMSAVVRGGTRIKIIHNIDRSTTEMFDAIESWMPLYMSGRIEPYYCIRPRDSRFNHTIFSCPGQFTLEGTYVRGMEKEGLYRFHTDPEFCSFFEDSFLILLSKGKRLVTTETPESDEVKIETLVNGIRIRITEEYVNISGTGEREFSFSFMHPLMCRAFSAYVNRIQT